jgi:hypothetical protein
MKVTEENAYDDLEFECKRCGTKVSRTSKFEPTVGYVSKVNGEFVQTCQKCYDELPENDRVFIPLLESCIIIGFRENGEGIILTEDGISTDYKRSPTPFELKAACRQVISDLEGMEQSKRHIGMLAQSGLLRQQGAASNNVIQLPRKK